MDLVVGADDVRVVLSSWERLGALHAGPVVARSAIRSARVARPRFEEVRGLRIGTMVPRRLALGRFVGRGYRDFVALRWSAPGVVVELDAGAAGFDRLVVSVPDPEGTVAALS